MKNLDILPLGVQYLNSILSGFYWASGKCNLGVGVGEIGPGFKRIRYLEKTFTKNLEELHATETCQWK